MSVVSLLGESAVRSLALTVVAGLALRLLRVQHARLAKRVWTSVLLLALAMPALVALGIPSVSMIALWSRPRTVILSAPRAASVVQPARLMPVPSAGPRVPSAPGMRAHIPVPPALQGGPTAAPGAIRRVSLWQIGLAAYLLITSLFLLRIAVGLVLALRLWRRAQHFAVSETDLPVRLSADLRSPATVGRGILLPLEAITWDRATLIATLAHEQEHVREGDFYLQLAGAVHHCFFWISPHAWWLRPQLSRLSETVCDRAAVASTGDGLGYAQLLLRFAGAERSRAAVVAMAQSAGMRERIEQLIADPLLSGAFYKRRGQPWALGIAVAAMAIPAAITVHIVQPSVVVLAAPQLPAPPAAQAATAMQPAAPQARSANPSAVPAPLPATDALPHSNAAAPVLAVRPNVKVSVLATPPVLSQMHLVVPVAAPIPMVWLSRSLLTRMSTCACFRCK